MADEQLYYTFYKAIKPTPKGAERMLAFWESVLRKYPQHRKQDSSTIGQYKKQIREGDKPL